jgi:hypothetical protein
MFLRHRSTKPVKAYLLGELGDREAELLEDKYFSDPVFFRWVRDVEESLIRDYLEGHLLAFERDRFESKYLRVRELKQRLEEVRAGATVARPTYLVLRWQIVLTGIALTFFIVSALLLWQKRHIAQGELARAMHSTVAPAILTIHLSPGVSMGARSASVEFTKPLAGLVHLILELPGQPSPLDCRVVLSVVASDGGRKTTWTSREVVSKTTGNSQQVSIDLDASILRPADYIGEVVSVTGTTIEAYVFRVNDNGTPHLN